jgi:hypothetical protein
MSLLVSGVLWNKVEIFSAEDESAVHFGGDDGAGKDASTDGYKASKWALLVCESSELVLMIWFLIHLQQAVSRTKLLSDLKQCSYIPISDKHSKFLN